MASDRTNCSRSKVECRKSFSLTRNGPTAHVKRREMTQSSAGRGPSASEEKNASCAMPRACTRRIVQDQVRRQPRKLPVHCPSRHNRCLGGSIGETWRRHKTTVSGHSPVGRGRQPRRRRRWRSQRLLGRHTMGVIHWHLKLIFNGSVARVRTCAGNSLRHHNGCAGAPTAAAPSAPTTSTPRQPGSPPRGAEGP